MGNVEIMLDVKLNDEVDLKLIHPRFAPEIFKTVDENRSHLRTWLPWVDSSDSIKPINEFVERSLALYKDNGAPVTPLLCKNRVIGMIGLHDVKWESRTSSIGYWIAEEYQGKGLIILACRHYEKIGFMGLELDFLEIHCATGNKKSIEVAKRLGYELETTVEKAENLNGTMVDHFVFRKSKAKWEKETLGSNKK